VCKDAVLSRLKSPASARFARAPHLYQQYGAWIAEGEVDSKNEYGAMLRSTFKCDMEKLGGAWRSKGVTFH
jgi:hypothetical protein